MTYEENVRAILESNFAGFKEEVIDTACKMILGLRTYGEWIPCDEQLPKRNELVLVSIKRGIIRLLEYLDDGTNTPWISIDDCCEWNNNAVNAWMPVPEAYKEEEIKMVYSNKLDYVGFSDHDCESHYKCPFCGEHYGAYSIPIGGLFKCKCGKYVWTD